MDGDRFTYDRTRRAVMLGDKVYWDDIDARAGAIIAEALGNEDYATRCLADLREQLRAATARAAATEAECERLGTWDGIMSVLNALYPPDVFTGVTGDSGPTLIALVHEVERLRADAALGALAHKFIEVMENSPEDNDILGVEACGIYAQMRAALAAALAAREEGGDG